ncbi:MAG: signal recognition particle receptor subunit alpha [Candidatus Nanoarchaeia archaeon]|nr:signal recognition particle receptor subunit alpha [Candidatus Nanoarchaeia archaeon]
MVLEKLGNSLKNVLKKIAGAGLVNEKLVDEIVKEIQRALLSADVNVSLVFELTKGIKERALKEKAPAGVTQKEFLVNIVYEELVKFLGEEKSEVKIDPKKKPFKIMMLGLFGSGKTTSCGKLANYYKKRGHKVATLGLDTYRPAAADQLEQVSEKVGVSCFIDKKEKNAVKIYKKFVKELDKFDLVIIDTAGRDALSKDLIEEIEAINKEVEPDENLLVISGDIGQSAQKQAEQFHKSCGVTGVIVTKLDGTAKGGGALTACATTKASIKFIGVGERTDDLETFNPKGFVGRILGMGDIEALLEKTKETISEEQAQDLGKKFLKGEFNFLDLYEQLSAVKKMGPLTKVIEMIPGFGKLQIPKEVLEQQEGSLDTWKIVMQSMTKEELEDPDVLTRSRIDRIALGAGVSVGAVRQLLKQYKQSKKMMKMMKGKNPEKLMKKFGGMKL